MEYNLLNRTDVYFRDTVDEALALREELSQDPEYELVSFTYTTKFNKKAEREYQVVKAKKVYKTEKGILEGDI